jgi:hypothetical protein
MEFVGVRDSEMTQGCHKGAARHHWSDDGPDELLDPELDTNCYFRWSAIDWAPGCPKW